MPDREKLGQLLVKEKKITEEQFKKAKIMHDNIGGEFGALLVKLGYVTDEIMTDSTAKLEGIETIDITSLVIPKKLVNSIPRDVIEKHGVMPISKREGHLVLAMSDINDFDAVEEIQFLTGFRIEPVLASRDAIRKAIIQFYYSKDKEESTEKEKEEKGGEKDAEGKGANELFEELKLALIPLLIEKKYITEEELIKKAREIGANE